MDEKITFKDFDKLDRKPFAEKLTMGITTFHPFVEEAYVLSLNAEFGEGKTTFLHMWQDYLEKNDHTVIYLNAWESDFDDEPLIPIASSLLEKISSDTTDENAKKTLSNILGLVAEAANSAVEHSTGINFKKLDDAHENNNLNEQEKLNKQGEQIYKEFLYKKKAYKKLKESLKTYVENLEKKPLFILVDELDRVRPDYAVKFLEAIKHIFSVQGICFVLAVNRQQLEASVRQLYGKIDFDNYYGRFVTREVQLPQISEIKDLSGFIEHVSKDYFDEKISQGISFAFKKNQIKDVLSYAELVCRAFELKARQIEYLFRIYSQFMAVNDSDNRQKMDTWIQAPLILIAIFIKDKNLYKKIGKGTLSPYALYKYLNTLNFSNTRTPSENKEYIIMYSLAFILTKNNILYKKEAKKIAGEFYQNDSDIEPLSVLRKIYNFNCSGDFPNSESTFQSFYKKLEEWRSFIE